MLQGFLKRNETPNPDILCNREIKFKAFSDYVSVDLGIESICTGHYARLKPKEDGSVGLFRGIDVVKDQSYFLCQVPHQALKRYLFPIGDYRKEDVRELARKLRIPSANKKSSAGICFVGKSNKFATFLKEYAAEEFCRSGAIRDIDSDKVIGEHSGLWNFTIGQRVKLSGLNHPLYVVKKEIELNQILVGRSNDPRLFSNSLRVRNLTWISGDAPSTRNVQVKWRSRSELCDAEICSAALNAPQIEVKFARPGYGIAPGQVLAFYQGEECIGGGEVAERID
jgi:tRNA-specific 2-thiouridylase